LYQQIKTIMDKIYKHYKQNKDKMEYQQAQIEALQRRVAELETETSQQGIIDYLKRDIKELKQQNKDLLFLLDLANREVCELKQSNENKES